MSRSVLLCSQLVAIFAKRAARLGVDVLPILEREGLGQDALDQPEIMISVDTLRSFLENLAAKTNDSAFGFHAALEMPRGAYGVIEYVVRSAATLGDVIHQLTLFGRLVNGRLEVTFDPRTGRLEQRIPQEPEGLGKHGNEFSLVHQIVVTREATASRIVPTRVYFAHTKHGDDSELAAWLGTRAIEYGATFNGVDLTMEALATPVASSDPSLLGILERQARTLAEKSAIDEVDVVRRGIERELAAGEPTGKRIAKSTGMSERTLHRRLAEHGTTLRELVDEARQKLAVAYLRDRNKPLGAIAVDLGYSDGRAFARAFRRWMGDTPAAWRAAHV